MTLILKTLKKMTIQKRNTINVSYEKFQKKTKIKLEITLKNHLKRRKGKKTRRKDKKRSRNSRKKNLKELRSTN